MYRAVVVVAIALVACKGKPKHRPPPANLGSIDPNGRPSVTPSTQAPDIVLPSGTGKPPVKTTGPLPLKTLLALQQRTWKGFQVQPHAIDPDKGMEVRHITEDKPKIAATITVAPCSAESVLGPCLAMELPLWKATEAHLKLMLPERLRPTAQFEVGSVKFHGTNLIYTFQVGQESGTFSTGANAGKSFVEFSYAYILYYNDSQNQIRVVAEYKDEAQDTKELMEKAVPRGDLEATAQGFFDAFTQLW